MTRTELIETLATRAGMDRKDAKTFLDALTAVIEDSMRRHDEVPLKGLGKFKVQHRKARMGRNPITGAEVPIPEKTVAKFTMAKALKDLI